MRRSGTWLTVALVSLVATQYSSAVLLTVASEGSLRNLKVAPTLAATPGAEPGFYNPKRRIGRDFVVLSVAQWLAHQAAFDDSKCIESNRPARLLDAMCATGMQGLRAAVESPLLAKASLQVGRDPPELQVVLNDMDKDAVAMTKQNAVEVADISSNVTMRVAQALLQEESFEICVLDPFGSVTPFLDAAFARAPHLGLVEISATDVSALYGSRPRVTRRHYNHAHLSKKRPPCYRERGVRLLIAAVAQAAGRHDRGVVPLCSVSTEHFVLLSLRVVRGARAADDTADQVQPVRICRVCGAHGIGLDAPTCGCEPNDGAGTDASEEGPLWIGQLYDADTVQAMARMASLPEAGALISKETRALLVTLQEEASVNGMFYRRPGVVAGGQTPKLAKVVKELQSRGYAAASTHFDTKALRTDASVDDFDLAAKAVILNDGKAGPS